MKKFLAITLLVLVVLISLGYIVLSTMSGDDTGSQKPDVQIRIGYMAGPTGMGMAKLVSNNGGLENGNEYYTFTKYTDTTTAKADLAAGKIDIICLPTNEAAQYYVKIDKNAKVLALNCLNSLYYVEHLSFDNVPTLSLSDLEGQTIYTCKNGTPRMVLEYLLEAAEIDATVSYSVDGKEILTPADLSAMVIAGKIPNAVMPEPIVTSTVLGTMDNKLLERIYEVKLDLADEWDKISDTPIAMGCVIANGDFVSKHKNAVDSFLAEYKESVDYISNPKNIDSAAEYVVETGVMGASAPAKMALENLGDSICYIDGEEMKNALLAFYSALEITAPASEFYYEK